MARAWSAANHATRHWRRWLPHKASAGVRVQGVVHQIVGGRRWSLCLITAMEPAAERTTWSPGRAGPASPKTLVVPTENLREWRD